MPQPSNLASECLKLHSRELLRQWIARSYVKCMNAVSGLTTVNPGDLDRTVSTNQTFLYKYLWMR